MSEDIVISGACMYNVHKLRIKSCVYETSKGGITEISRPGFSIKT